MDWTKGEWKLHKTQYGEYVIKSDKSPIPIAQIFDQAELTNEMLVNANLLVTAPKLYQALKDLVNLVEIGVYAEQGRKALAQAEGK